MKQYLPLIINKDDTGKNTIHLYADIDVNGIQRQISYLSTLPRIKGPITLLPDFHHKPGLETPSSSVVMTEKFFSPALTSPSQNCGMSCVLTPLFQPDITPDFLDRFFNRLKKSVPLENKTPVLSKEETWQALLQGAEWAVKKYNLSEDLIHHIENRGNLSRDEKISVNEIKNAIPPEIIEHSRYRFSIIGGGNHFLEFQTIDEILDPAIAKEWKLRKGQIVILYHTGSDTLGAYLGRLYATRRKTDLKHRFVFFRKKIRHHLLQGDLSSPLKRLSWYFMPGVRFIDPNTREGEKALLAFNSAANFGFASRVSIFNRIQNVLKSVCGDKNFELHLLYDCSHNSIYRETGQGRDVWVHRHNACGVYPPSRLEGHPFFKTTGQPVILPGTSQTSSYICAAGEGVAAVNYTVDHGLGAIQKRFENQMSPRIPEESNLLFTYEKKIPEKIPMYPDNSINEAIDILTGADIIKTVVRLRPMATLKGPENKII